MGRYARWWPAKLHGVKPLDPIVMSPVIATLAVVGLAGCVLPAHRANRVDPVTAPRSSKDLDLRNRFAAPLCREVRLRMGRYTARGRFPSGR